MNKEGYLLYLQSNHWKDVRNAAFSRAGFRCGECGDNTEIQVHHLTYDNIGNEKPGDLVVLCRTCHMLKHVEKFDKSPRRVKTGKYPSVGRAVEAAILHFSQKKNKTGKLARTLLKHPKWSFLAEEIAYSTNPIKKLSSFITKELKWNRTNFEARVENIKKEGLRLWNET